MGIDHKMFETMERELNTAVLCDILDSIGYRNQAMKGNLYPLFDGHKLVGRAKTILAYDVFEQPEVAYSKEIEAVDSVAIDDVIVCANSSCSNGFWGELMATAAVVRGARGVIVDGAIRDITKLKEFDEKFKVFTKARNPLDSKGRCIVADYDCPVMCDGVVVHPGDIIFGDIDGIVVVPVAVANQVIELALEKVCAENIVREELFNGASLKEVFSKYQIL